jgi:hypothetical protein
MLEITKEILVIAHNIAVCFVSIHAPVRGATLPITPSPATGLDKKEVIK